MRDVCIDRIMTANPVATGPNVPIVEARALLESKNLHHLPVVEGDKLVGIICASDMLKFCMLDENSKVLKSIQVRQVMRASPHFVTVGSSLRNAANVLSSGGFHALPVVEPDQTLVGIVTSSDLIHHLLQQLPVGDGSIRTKAIVIDEQTPESLNKHTRQLDAVYQAAESYVRSGHADREHSVLVKCLADVRAADADLNL